MLESSVSHSRSAETTGDSPLPLNHIDDGDDTTFSPSAAPSIPSSPRARRESHNELEEVKQAKLLEALQDNPAEYAQEHNLTLAERKTLAKMKFEKEKKEKLQMYLKVQDQSQEAEIDPTKAPERSAISDRFLQAKLNQQKAEEERLARIRNNPNRQLTRTVSVKDAWDNALDNANKEPDKSKKSIIRAGSVRNVWDNTLNESKEIEANRFLDIKRKTISQFRITEGTGFVRKKVNEWEEVFIQLAATAEEYDEFLRAAMMRIDAARSRSGSIHNMEDELKRQKEEQRKFQESSTIPEKFEIGATHIYSVKLLESHVASMLNKSLKEQKLKHLSLSCWVYGEQSKKPPIDVFAAVIRTDDKSMYVSLTIKASIGAELDPSVYGLKKVSVFLNELKVLDRLLEVVPMQGYEGWIAAGSYDIHATESQEQGTKTSKSREVIASISESDEEDLDVVDNEKILSEGEVDSMLTGLASSSNSKPRKTVGIAEEEDAPINEESELEISRFTDSTLDPANVSVAPLQDDERLDVDLLNDSTVMCLQDTMQMEDVAELSTVAEDEEGIPLKIESPLVVDGPDEGNGTWRMNLTPKLDAEDDAPFSEDTVNTDQIGEFGNQVQRRKPSTLTDDETVDDDIIMEAHEPYNLGRLMSVAHVGESRAFMPTHIEPEELYYGSRGKGNKANKYPWQLKDEAEDGLGAANSASVILNINDVVSHSCSNNCLAIQGHEFTTVFTGTLKSGKTDTKFIVDNDKIFEWVRGAAISG